MMRLRFWLLALALLWVQLAAVLHGLEHLHDADDPDHPPCEWCLAYGSVQHAAAGQPPMLPVAGQSAAAPPPVLIAAPARLTPHYDSRAPPASLV